MAQWQIDSQEYLMRLDLDRLNFERHLKLPNVVNLELVVPLRDMAVIQSIVPIDSKLLAYLITRIRTFDGRLPFQNSEISQVVTNTRQLKIGQRYVYRENYQALLESGISKLFEPFLGQWAGLGNLGAYFVFGLNRTSNYSMACYIPPIIEVHGSRSLVMDGIHRNYIARQSGLSTINAVLVQNVEVPFPCATQGWEEIKVIPLVDKPKNLEDRYFSLQKNLFRDLKYLGIDG